MGSGLVGERGRAGDDCERDEQAAGWICRMRSVSVVRWGRMPVGARSGRTCPASVAGSLDARDRGRASRPRARRGPRQTKRSRLVGHRAARRRLFVQPKNGGEARENRGRFSKFSRRRSSIDARGIARDDGRPCRSLRERHPRERSAKNPGKNRVFFAQWASEASCSDIQRWMAILVVKSMIS